MAVAFSSNPQVSRPDIVTLRDDSAMIYPDRVVPVARRKFLRAYGKRRARDIRRRLNAASSAALTTLALRGLNQAVIDGRLPGGRRRRVRRRQRAGRRRVPAAGPRIVVGYMAFAENETLAHLYAEALRAGGFRVIVRPRRRAAARGRRQAPAAAQIDLYPAYDGSLLRYLVGTSPARLKAGLKRTLARIGAEPMRLSRAQDRNVFVTKTDTASRLGLARISDLARYWQTAGQ